MKKNIFNKMTKMEALKLIAKYQALNSFQMTETKLILEKEMDENYKSEIISYYKSCIGTRLTYINKLNRIVRKNGGK